MQYLPKHFYSRNRTLYVLKMPEFQVDNIFVVFAGNVFQLIVGIPVGTNCAPLIADIFLHSYEAELIQYLLSAWKKQLVSQFNFTYRYIHHVLSIDNQIFEKKNWLNVSHCTWNQRHDGEQHFCFLLGFAPIDQREGQFHTFLYDKCYYFNFHITNFAFLSSNIPSSPAYGFLSHNILDTTGSSYECFILRAIQRSNKLFGRGGGGVCQGTFEIVS